MASGGSSWGHWLFDYLFLFGVELETLIQGAAVLLDMLLLLIPHALCILHHLLLNVPKQAAAPGHKDAVIEIRQKVALCQVNGEQCYRKSAVVCNRKQTDQSLILCSHSMMSFTCGGPPEPQSFRALEDMKGERSSSAGEEASAQTPLTGPTLLV